MHAVNVHIKTSAVLLTVMNLQLLVVNFFKRLLPFPQFFADHCHSLLLAKAEPHLAEMHRSSISLYTSGKKKINVKPGLSLLMPEMTICSIQKETLAQIGFSLPFGC